MTTTEPGAVLQQAAWMEIQRLNLESYVADLEANGFTIIPPGIASPGDLHERLLDRTLELAERESGIRPDLEGGGTHKNYKGRFAGPDGDSPFGQYLQTLIFEGPVFEEALMNPVLLAMGTYLCGYHVVLSSMSCFVKGPNETTLPFHSDTLVPPPFPAHALVCNGTYVLTEFNRENGSTAFVPGSHKLLRLPQGNEHNITGPEANPNAVAVEASPGSLVVWHGNTWHGAFNRTAPGLRVSMPVLMARPYMRTEEDLFGKIPPEVLDRNPTRFALLTQQGVVNGWSSQKNSIERAAHAREVQQKFFAEAGLPYHPPGTHLYG